MYTHRCKLLCNLFRLYTPGSYFALLTWISLLHVKLHVGDVGDCHRNPQLFLGSSKCVYMLECFNPAILTVILDYCSYPEILALSQVGRPFEHCTEIVIIFFQHRLRFLYCRHLRFWHHTVLEGPAPGTPEWLESKNPVENTFALTLRLLYWRV